MIKRFFLLSMIIGLLFVPHKSLSVDARTGELFETTDDIMQAIRKGKTSDYKKCVYLTIMYDDDGSNSIPENIFSFFPNVKELTIEAGVSCINYYSIKDMKSLEILLLGNNCLTDIGFLEDLPNLRRLAVPHNHIRNGDPISFLSKLEFLNIEDNEFSDISFVMKLNNLRDLIINDNKDIYDITPLSNLILLEGLYMSNTSVTDISTIKCLTNLSELDISELGINDLSPLSALENLVWLDARNNCITDASPLCTLKKLELIYLDGNPIQNIHDLNKGFD